MKNFNQLTFNIEMMEYIINNRGLDHIAIQIFGYLSHKELIKCRLVSQVWKDFVDKEKLLQQKLKELMDTKIIMVLVKRFPKWHYIINRFLESENTVHVAEFIELLDYYTFKANELSVWKYGTPTHLASADGKVNFLKLLNENNISLDDKIILFNPQSPFELAVSEGQAEVVKFFIDQVYMDINQKDIHGSTHLHMACHYKRRNVVEKLLECSDIEVNSRDSRGSTPLHVAVDNPDDMQSCLEIVELLTQHKDIKIDALDADGFTPALRAHQYGNVRHAATIRKYRQNPDK